VGDTIPDVDMLVAAIQAQESSALQTLYESYGGQVYSLAMAVTHQRETAEEVTQDVFLRVWNKVEQYEPGTNFRAWLLRITRNVAIDYLRRSRRDWDHTFLWDVELLAETGGLSDDDARWVRRALYHLSDEQRQVIELAYLQGMTHQQIADVLHLPLGTVKTRIRDGLHKLRDVMQKEGER
jgi:RNA polymerase sigma-70 factor (ECF subfamily)